MQGVNKERVIVCVCASVGESVAQINKSSKLEAVDTGVLRKFYKSDVSLEVVPRVFFSASSLLS